MGIFSASSPFDQDVERATSETSTSEEWGLMMEICDRAGAGGAAGARECLRAVLRRLAHADPHVQVHAATLLDACVANCGRAFLLEVASRDFETEFRRLLARAQPPVAARLRALLRKWATGEFRDDPQLDLIPSLHARLSAADPAAAAPAAPAATHAPAGAPAAADAADDDLARAIALSLRDTGPALYPRVEPDAPAAAPTPAATPAPAPAPPPPRKVRALYDFEAAEDNELTFLAGETVHVTDSSDPNWWKGYNERGEGLFPANFVSDEEPAGASAGAAVAAGAAGAVGAAGAAGAEEESEGAGAGEERVTHIDESVMDEALALLHEADPTGGGGGGGGGGAEEARAARLEARAHAMGALVDAALERADRRHARLTQLSAELVDALNLYHSLMRDPRHAPAPAPGPAPGPYAPPPPPPPAPAHPFYAMHAHAHAPPRC